MNYKNFVLSYGLVVGVLLVFTACGSLPKVHLLHDPLSPEEHLQLGERYEAEGKLDLALNEYQAALKGGDRSEAFAHLGNAHSLKGDRERAEFFYLRSLKEGGDQPLVLNNLAALYAIQGRELHRAEKMVKKALQIDPEHSPYYLETLSEVYFAQKRYDDALQALSDAEKSAAADPLLQKSLGFQKVRIKAVLCGGPCGNEKEEHTSSRGEK